MLYIHSDFRLLTIMYYFPFDSGSAEFDKPPLYMEHDPHPISQVIEFLFIVKKFHRMYLYNKSKCMCFRGYLLNRSTHLDVVGIAGKLSVPRWFRSSFCPSCSDDNTNEQTKTLE